MVGSLMLLKMLHCKRRNRNRRKESHSSKTEVDAGTSQGSSSLNIKIEPQESDGPRTCRVCLQDGDIPIYGNSSANVSEELNTFGGIAVSADDPYPKFLCQSCNALLEGAVIFRKTAQRSDQLLRDQQFSYHSYTEDVNDDNIDTSTDETFDYNVDKVENEETKPRDKSYHCTRCNIDFDTLEEYSEHRLSQEHENHRETCQICNNTYSSLYFKRHMALHKMESSYMCDICGKKFIIQGQFMRHHMTHFVDNLPFQCTLCPYKGRFRESLKMHMRTHTGEKPYKCPHCPSRYFVNKSNLNKHLLTHKRDHDFKCSQCQRGFYRKKDLDLHFKVDHSGIKDHVCNICGKPFGYRKQMMKHQLKVHKREKLRTGRTPLYLLAESKKQMEEQG